MNRIFCCLLLLALHCQVIYAKGVKYGKVNQKEIDLQYCDFEKDAGAVVLSSSCKVDVKEKEVEYLYHVRIKILKEEAFSLGNVKIPYYKKNRIEGISKIKAQTINYDANGNQSISELKSDAVFRTDRSESYGEYRFTLPNIKVGSIIEYSYTKLSDFHTFLDTYYFQSEIPTLYSAVEVKFTPTFKYDLIMIGDQLKKTYKGKHVNKWELNNLPSIKEAAYINNYMDYVEQLRFQLVGYDHGSGYRSSFNSSWEQLGADYFNRLQFLNKKSFAAAQLEKILSGKESQQEKLEKIYKHVQSSLKWNHFFGVFPKNSPAHLLEKKVGTSGEINLYLILLLKEAKIKASPALIRTNSRGLLQKKYPLLSQFNSLIAFVEMGEQKLFVDATSKYRPYDLVNVKDLNYHAFIVSKRKSHWEKLEANPKQYRKTIITYDFRDINKPLGHVNVVEEGYYAEKDRLHLAKNELTDMIHEVVDESYAEFSLDSVKIRNQEELKKPLEFSLAFNIEDVWEEGTNRIFFSPFVDSSFKNPFTEEKRQYRIDFNFPYQQEYVLKIQIPDNYMFEGIPDPKSVQIPNKGGRFTYLYQENQKILTIKVKYEINRPFFGKQYYPYLKGFFSKAAEKIKEKVIIKKVG